MPAGPLVGRAVARELLFQAAAEVAHRQALQVGHRALLHHIAENGPTPPTNAQIKRAMRKAQRGR